MSVLQIYEVPGDGDETGGRPRRAKQRQRRRRRKRRALVCISEGNNNRNGANKVLNIIHIKYWNLKVVEWLDLRWDIRLPRSLKLADTDSIEPDANLSIESALASVTNANFTIESALALGSIGHQRSHIFNRKINFVYKQLLFIITVQYLVSVSTYIFFSAAAASARCRWIGSWAPRTPWTSSTRKDWDTSQAPTDTLLPAATPWAAFICRKTSLIVFIKK
jgi:hypothetical protein